ncbi:MAG: TlyA family RNA methyltransferase [Lachnospiraceae bacterium]|nr:TlyA family RNA methyltransferase [Lachnospiraceae bacterium]
MPKKITLIEKMLTEGWASDEKEALALVMCGSVLVNDYPASSIKEKVPTDSLIRIRGKNNTRYVTRAGMKLEKGLSHFSVLAKGKTCLDIGASEGGFTDCLLKHGAAKIYAVDVAYGILDWSLRNNEKVIVLERTNARYLDEKLIPEPIDLLVSDVSFISLKKILPIAAKLLKPEGLFIVLYKPQFELLPELLGKNGNVLNPAEISEGINEMRVFLEKNGIFVRRTAESPIRGSNGNVEYLLYGDIMA